MRRISLILFLALLTVGFAYVLIEESDDADIDIEGLARRHAQRELEKQRERRAEKRDLGRLAKKGLGQELPADLIKYLDPSGRFWFVGKTNSQVGVEIPFEPGRIRTPPPDHAPLGKNPGFLGAEACRSCHQDKYETFIHTAHHRTSRIANAETISGSFEEGKNELPTSDPNVHFTMIRRDGVSYQRTSFFDWKFEVPFDLIIGSSKMAETYLYWHGDKLFQMNCTYLSERDTWINSPGFVDGDAAFARPIQAGCLECHVTYIELRKSPNTFTPSSLILGISCERCHGPGNEHVDFHAAHPMEKESRSITVPSKLTRQAEMDVCGQCHTAGKAPLKEEAFQLRPGDKISDHYETLVDHDESTNSVHTSNQIARLGLSECFKQSEMACVQCHDPHRNERGQRELFSARCLKCHQEEHCGMSERLGPRLSENCIDCHMPRRATANVRMETAVGNVFLPLRDHYIRVDRQATDEYLRSIEDGNESSK